MRQLGPVWGILSAIWHSFAARSFFMPLLRIYVRLNIRAFGGKKTAPIKILALNDFRYRPDLEILNVHDDIVIYTLPHNVQTLINSLFYRQLPKALEGLDNTKKYAAFRALEDKEERAALVSYLEEFLPPVLEALTIDGIMSCSFFYIADIDWQRACKNQNIPYFALHKENMQDGVVHDQMIKRYSDMGIRYYGQRMFLYNHLVKKVILGAKICQEEAIVVTGAARMDALFKKVRQGEVRTPKRQVTLFSSHHCIGLLQVPKAVNYFSQNPDEGFVKYFDLVHGNMIKFAHDNPDVDVFIKPKWGDNWIDYIKKSGTKIGLNADNTPNLHITWEMPAQDLIEDSGVVVGINSTTLLESLIMGRPVVLPLFAEASGKYYDRHVYFKDYEDDAFNVVRDPEKLGQAILNELDGKEKPREMPKAMIEDYLGYCDDNATNRIVEQIKIDIKTLKG